jgi:hypothetical protein
MTYLRIIGDAGGKRLPPGSAKILRNQAEGNRTRIEGNIRIEEGFEKFQAMWQQNRIQGQSGDVCA